MEPYDTKPGHVKEAARSEWVLYGRNDHLAATTSLTRLRRKITEWTAQETKQWDR